MAHHTHFTYPQRPDTDHTSGQHPPPCCSPDHDSCPTALAHRIGHWLWLNVLVSLCSLAVIAASTGQRWLVFVLRLITSTPKAKSRIRSQQPLDRATAFSIAALIVAGLCYTGILLALSRRERNITEQAAAQTTIISPIEEEIEALDVLEDAADETSRVTERESVVFLMLVVCQNGLAALLLYVGIRVMFVLKSSATELWDVAVYVEVGYTIVQVALMTFVIVHCAMQDDTLGEYLQARQGLQAPEKTSGWFDHGENDGHASPF